MDRTGHRLVRPPVEQRSVQPPGAFVVASLAARPAAQPQEPQLVQALQLASRSKDRTNHCLPREEQLAEWLSASLVQQPVALLEASRELAPELRQPVQQRAFRQPVLVPRVP